MPGTQFQPQYFQSAPPPTYNEQGVAEATIERQRQQQAAVQALVQLAQQNQQIQVARGELTRKMAEDEAMANYRSADIALRGTALGQEGDIARQQIALGYAGQQTQRDVAEMGEAGATERTGMQIGANQQIEGQRQAGEDRRLGQTLTTGSDENAARIASAERIAAGRNETDLAATQMTVDARTAAAQGKFAARPFHWEGKEYTLPEGEVGQRAWARRMAFRELSETGRYKEGAELPKDVVEAYARDYIDPALGLGPITLSPAEAHAKVSEEIFSEIDKRAAAGEDRSTLMQELGGQFDARVEALLSGKPAQQPQGPPTGPDEGPAPQQEPSIEELDASPLASDRARAQRMREQQRGEAEQNLDKMVETQRQVKDLEKTWNTTYEADYGKAPRTRAEWVQMVDAVRTKKPKPITRAYKGGSEVINENPAEQQLLKLGQVRGFKWPSSPEDWAAIKAELSGGPKKE